MRKFYLVLFVLWVPFLVSGQTYGNEWINYSQKYYKIKVINDGVYRIDSLVLAQSGISLNGLDPRHFQIFYKGQEQYIYVQGQNDGVFNKNDYVEFYGKHNDGTIDSLVYTGISFNPNPYYSMFNDTSTYYLTWNGSLSNHRLIMETSSASGFGSYTPANYFIAQAVNYGNSQFYEGARIQVPPLTASDPRYSRAEGWFFPELDLDNSQTYSLNVSNVYTSGPAAFISTEIFGESTAGYSPDHEIQVYSTWAGSLPMTDTLFNDDFPQFIKKYSVAASQLSNGSSLTFKSVANNLPGAINASGNTTAISYIYTQYPHDTNMGGASTFMMYVPNGGTSTYLDLTNFNASVGDTVRFYDYTDHYRLKVFQSGSTVKVIIPSSASSNMQCYITSDNQIYNVTKLIPAGNSGTFTSFVPSSRSLSPYIIISHPSLWPEATAYAAYRSHKYDVVLANVEELYDQFGYGIEKDPLGIKRFCNYAVNNWRVPPAYLFLLGKGIHTPLYRQDASAYAGTLVPSFGYPSSDILLSTGFTTPGSLKPAIPTGRLAAVNGTEVNNYLSKVETYESNAPAQWMKKIIHFCGGDDAQQQAQFLSYLNNYATIAKAPLLGAFVYTFQKTSQSPIQITLADSVTNIINNGVSVMTFFGHADGSNFDESLDAPSDYNNIGKYPLIIANACFSGDIFQPIGTAQSSSSEQFVLDPKGSIGFLAADDLGVAGELYNYTEQLYTDFSSLMYRKPLGNCIQATIGTVQNTNDILEKYTCMEMTLHGDPAIAIVGGDSLPDYAVNDSSVFFTPSNVTTQIDSFNVNVIVSNLGEAVLNQSVQVAVTRYLPSGLTSTYVTTLTHLYYQDTAVIRLPVDLANGVGLNRFYVDVDPSNLIRELTKTNNQIGPPGFPPAVNLLITSGDIIPVFPYQFAIIPGDTTTLKASTGDPNASLHSYIFEIDTAGDFSSPWLKSQVVSSTGGVVCAPSQFWTNTPAPGPGGSNGNQSANGQRVINTHTNTNINTVTSIPSSLSQESMLSSPHLITPNSSPAQNNVKSMPSSIALNSGVINSTLSKSVNTASTGISNQNIMGGARIKSTAPPLKLTDTVVYFWRVRRDTTDTKDYQWQGSSFQYIKGKNGWAQAHYYQFLNNNYNYITTNKYQRNWSFSPIGKTLECFTYGAPLSALETQTGFDEYLGRLYQTSYKLDITQQSAGGCQINPALFVAVIDPISLTPWSTLNYYFGNVNNSTSNATYQCSYPDKKFIFWESDYNQMTGMKNMLQNSTAPNGVPNGDYILIYSWTEGSFSTWANHTLMAELKNLGADTAIMHPDSVPFIFFVQKGNPASAITLVGKNMNDSLHLTTTLSSNENFGTMTSPLIGPAAKWDSLSWNQHLAKGASNHDSVRLNIIGDDIYGNQKTLLTGITPSVANMYISSISPKSYPYLQLMLYTQDLITHKPSQMRKWQVFYTPVPEVAVNPSIYSYFHKDTLQVGDSIYYKTVVQNIGSYPMDSMIFNSWLVDAGNALHYLPVKYTKKLNPGDTTMLVVKASSAGYFGHNSVWMEVNPLYQTLTRPEEYHFNDIAEQYFTVIADKINPLLDVTFDGIHIMNNDIVSAHPTIIMQVMDENKFLALNDTSDFAIFLRNTNTTTSQRVYFGSAAHPNPQLTFTPAVLPHNSCRITYTPSLVDGTYELTVQATDRSGNPSGGSAASDYVIDFQVINKPMISNVLNYPNPFSSSTRFVFTLTGSEVPTYFKIQIMTITGKVVKEITQEELGPLHIGNNITQYAWDGTDQFGDKLANGIYLYHIVSSIDGQDIDHYATSADHYFTKGWGKMCLIR